MSMMDSGLAFGNPFTPLHQSLMRAMPNAAQVGQPPIPQGDQTNTLMRAHNLRAGTPGAGQMTQGADRSGGPMGQSVSKYKLMMMAAAGMSDEDQKKFKPAVDDPNISPQALTQLLQMHARAKPPVQAHNFDGGGAQQQQQPNGGASIGGPTPANVPQGSIQVTQGSGRDGRAVMSQEAMHQWMQRVAQTMPQGESGQRISGTYTPALSGAGMAEWDRLNPGQPLPTRSTPVADHGFQVTGIQPPQQQQQPQDGGDPIVAMHSAMAQAGVAPEALAQWRAFAQSGAKPEQLNAAAQHFMDERFRQQSQDRSDLRLQQNNDRAGQRADRQATQQDFQNNGRVLDELQKQERELIEANPALKYGTQGADPNVVKDLTAIRSQQASVRSRMNQMVTPPQQQQQQQNGAPANGPQLPAPPQPGHGLDPQTAQHFLQAAGGDKNKARALAQRAGWSF